MVSIYSWWLTGPGWICPAWQTILSIPSTFLKTISLSRPTRAIKRMDKIPKMMIEGAGLSILSKKTAKEQLSANQTLIIIFLILTFKINSMSSRPISFTLRDTLQVFNILNLHFKFYVIIDPMNLKGQQKFNSLF